jgi:hypothetical protein
MESTDQSKSTSPRRPLVRILPFLLVVPLVLVPVVSYFAVTAGGGSGRLEVAQGSQGGSFHPVAGSFEPDSTTLEECGGRYSCLEQAFGNIAYTEGPQRALAIFETESVRNQDIARGCHRIVHLIGSAALARNQGNVARTFAQGSSTCASGYYHGILERAFVGLETKAEIARVARGLCSDAGIRPYGFLDYQCQHGLGHGLMLQTGYDLPTALELCGRLGSGWGRVTCVSGAFMENVSTRFGFRSRWVDEENTLFPCRTVRPMYRKACYVRASTWTLQVAQYDYPKAARTCESAGPMWAPYCFRGFGRDAVVEARYSDLGKTLELCKLAGRYLADCVYGAARTFGDGGALAGVQRAAAFCRTVPGDVRASCAEGYGLMVGLLGATPAARRAICRRLAPDYLAPCARAAAGEVDPSGARAWV